jgi:hypothetical protein
MVWSASAMSHLWDASAGLLLGRARWYKAAMSFFASTGGTAIAQLIFNGDATAAIANGTWTTLGVTQTQYTAPSASYLYLALFTGHPGEGNASNVECTNSNYGGYARVPALRYKSISGNSSGMAWTVTTVAPNPPNVNTTQNIVVTNAIPFNFPTCDTGAGGSGAVIRYWGLYDKVSGASSNLICYGPIRTSTATWKTGMYTDTVNGTIYSKSHGLSNGDQVWVNRIYNAAAGDMPSGGSDALVEGTNYFVKDVATDTFELSLSNGGTTLLPTNIGAFLFIKSATLAIANGSIPSFTTGSLVAARIC